MKRIRFFMTFSDNYLNHLRVLQNVGLTRIDPIEFHGHQIVAHRVDGIVKGLKQPDWPQDGWGALHRLAQMLCALCMPVPAGV